MITMELLGRVRPMHLRDKLSLHVISKRTHICNVASAWGKGAVEKKVQDSRRRISIEGQTLSFRSFVELNAWWPTVAARSRSYATRSAGP